MGVYDVLKDFAGPFSTICAATVAAIVTISFARRQTNIAQQQAKTASNKLKIDTFEIRYTAYRAAIEVAEAALHDIKFDEAASTKWDSDCSTALQSEFLFSEEKFQIIYKVVAISRSLRFQSMRMRGVREDEAQNIIRSEKLDNTEKELRALYELLPEFFGSELRLDFVGKE